MSGNNFRKILFFRLKIFFTITNSVDPDEMQHYAAFHLGLHCLQKYSFRGFPEYKGLSTEISLCITTEEASSSMQASLGSRAT